jgi:high-affinity Fe2+/Pb2+ permease
MSDGMGRFQRAMCSGMLGLEAVVLFLTTPVMLSLTHVDTAVALVVGLGLTVACVLAAGLMRTRVGGALGWVVQAAAIALGFLIGAMFALGIVFLALYAGSWFLGEKIDRERAEREALG